MLQYLAAALPAAARRPLAVACAAALGLASSAHAEIRLTGVVAPVGPVFNDINNAPPYPVYVGAAGLGNLSVDQGSTFQPALLYLGHGAGGQGSGVIDGAGSRLNLAGLGQGTRLIIGETGSGVLTVSGGAVVDGRINAAPSCLTGFCGALVGHGAGAVGMLNVTGAGSQASFLGLLHLASPNVYTLQSSGFVVGKPGAQALGSLFISQGGLVQSTNALVATGPGGPGALGTESSLANVVIDGAGSRWRLAHMTADSPMPFVTTANHAQASAQIVVRNGGRLEIDGGQVGGTGPNAYAGLNLSRGGESQFTVTGAGSAIDIRGRSTVLNVGRQGGQASLNVLDGATVDVTNLQVGRDGARGALLVHGAGSTVRLAGREGAAADPDTGPSLSVGRSGSGHVEISQGARVLLDNTVTDGGVPYTVPARVLVARTADATGSVALNSGGLLSASYVGIARGADGDTLGQGQMAITGATLVAGALEVGSTGSLLNNGLVQADTRNWGRIGGAGIFQGSLTNHGIVNPGNSPGRLTIDGDFINEAGGRLVLEIGADGQGGFAADQLVVAGQVRTSAPLDVTFRFLGAADPNAFLRSGAFTLATFFGGAGLDGAAGAFQGASFQAESAAYSFTGFSFDAQTGAQFNAVPVPEPASALLLAAGLLGLAGLARRRG